MTTETVKRITVEDVRKAVEQTGMRLICKHWGDAKSCGCVLTVLCAAHSPNVYAQAVRVARQPVTELAGVLDGPVSAADLKDWKALDDCFAPEVKEWAHEVYSSKYIEGFLAGYDDSAPGSDFPCSWPAWRIERWKFGYADGAAIRAEFHPATVQVV